MWQPHVRSGRRREAVWACALVAVIAGCSAGVSATEQPSPTAPATPFVSAALTTSAPPASPSPQLPSVAPAQTPSARVARLLAAPCAPLSPGQVDAATGFHFTKSLANDSSEIPIIHGPLLATCLYYDPAASAPAVVIEVQAGSLDDVRSATTEPLVDLTIGSQPAVWNGQSYYPILATEVDGYDIFAFFNFLSGAPKDPQSVAVKLMAALLMSAGLSAP